ncbi:MAG TPA: hypothetical protein VOB72_23025 [Candidatus Dormibacteraeota bacterium]|nr:hypothetical protein [Candidatus Dormibacteraeota bacterium]
MSFLTGAFGIRLVLWSGASVPKPVPEPLLLALNEVKVVLDDAHGDGFDLTFGLGRQDGGADYDALAAGLFGPLDLVLIGVVLGVVPEPLINGVVTEHHLEPTDEPGRATLTVRGTSVVKRMDLDEENRIFQNALDSVVATQTIGRYARYGIVPQTVQPTTSVRTTVEGNTHQHETDLKFLRRLARRNGFVFYLEPTAIGVSGAYWGRENRLGQVQPCLTRGMGASTTLESISFANDALAPVSASGSFVEPRSRTSLPIPPLPALRLPPLSANPAPANRTERLRGSANRSAADALMSAMAATTAAPEPVTAHGEVNTVRYGAVLRARRLVGVRGVGRTYDGVYYVNRVTHQVTTGRGYTQQFSCRREGTGALLPLLPC